MEGLYTFLFIFIEILVGYLIGNISFARIIASKKGVDITEVGSKNPGGTNVGRSVGKKEGITVMVIDIFKCFIPCLIVLIIITFAPLYLIDFKYLKELLICLMGVSITLGHAYPIFFKFQGGKCVACLAGFTLLLSPIIFLIAISIFFIILKSKKILSLASVICALILIILFIPPMFIDLFVSENVNSFNGGLYITEDFNVHLSYISFIFVSFLSILTLYRHKENIKRLFNHEEVETKFKHN